MLDTDIPARLDRLSWGRFHTLVIAALGITWVLDGLEVTLAGAVSGALQASPRLALSDAQIGLSASAYLIGAVSGALYFGWLTDRWGRKRLFNITLLLYLVSTLASACAVDFWSFALLRALTGAGIGGEYAAINSAIQELIPARLRGRTDLLVNGSFWLGAAAGAGGAVWLLQPGLLPPDMGWRLAFGIGAVLGLIVLLLRQWVPESPRWLMTKGRIAEAEAILAEIEERCGQPAPAGLPRIRLRTRDRAIGFVELGRSLLRDHRRRVVLGLVLMVAQAFFYNAIFFTYPLVLGRFYQVPADRIGLYILPFAAGNFFGPMLLGRLFDTVGRKVMITLTYALSGGLLLLLAGLFAAGQVDAVGQTIGWSVIFFFASAAASSAYLTVSESFPLEIRALVIALFYALGTAVGGVAGPAVFGQLIGTGARLQVGGGYVFAAALMLIAAVVELRLGVAAERRPLEEIARPLAGID
ncbi:MFS transporter [Aliidongia dinghuensis]|uniref:MFS transporter n=1 Tax=Aliidongia dinghuensis TaxID=1867774 RepID=A0A8J3E715_9PROT|nr:MFS transporter [Aliidongia dinghuensis]